MNLSQAVSGKKYKRPTRVGRGAATGQGKTSGRGMRGAKSRSGGKVHPTYEGGQTPLFRRLPKRGFNNARFQRRPVAINVGRLINWPGEEEVTPEALLKAGLVDNIANGVKILGNGDVVKPLTVKATAFSEKAKEKIIAAGGKAELIQ